jgi:hypothetical protein
MANSLGAGGLRFEREGSIGWCYIDRPHARAGTDVIPFLTIRDSRAPVIAAVNGICQTGGLLVAMMADICVASDRATFRVPELLRGIPDATYAAVLPAHCGVAEVLRTPPMARMMVKRMLNERCGTFDYQTMFWALE